MELKEIGHRHGAAARWAAVFAVAVVVALGRDVALNARRGAGYLAGFAQGLLRPNA
jgi:hypothetical protein